MKITLNWLRRHVAFDWSPEELSERLTMLGLEVEGVHRVTGALEGVVVARVLSREKHPGADRLSVCRVDDGRGGRQIVCGASNFQPGDTVPLILPGAALPPKAGEKEPFVIKVGKIRGVESHGMMCSHTELGLDPGAFGLKAEDGLLILQPDAVVGRPLAEHLGLEGGDVVYDLEVTPNRPDLNSVVGIAREIAALTGNALRPPETGLPPGAGEAAARVTVRIEAPDLCPRYVARVVRGVKIGPSPDWLRTTLERVGLRSINNVVDVTNFVMLETGQPLHAFDLRLLAATDGVAGVVVRRSAAGERFTTLDGREHALPDDTLMIADTARAIALAGVMGGLDTGIRDDTAEVLVESAAFAPSGIRRTSKALGLRTDASYRFERGCDIEACDFAARRCVRLILQTAGGDASEGRVDVRPAPSVPREIPLRHARTDAVLGVTIAPEEQARMLAALGLVETTVGEPRGAESRWLVPSWRVDLKREADLIEEIARLYGVDRIPSSPPRGALGSHPFDAQYDRFADVRRLLTGLGLDEAQGQTLVAEAAARRVSDDVVPLANPLSADMNVLRPSLMPGLLDTLGHNLARRNGNVRVFEIGRAFARDGDAVAEGWRVAAAMTGAREPRFWSGADRDARCDVHDLKGVLEELFERLGLRGVVFARREEPTALFAESAVVALGGKLPLGQIGRLQPAIARRHDLRDPVFLAELDLGQIHARSNPERTYRPLAPFPAVQRDVAMIVPEALNHDAVLAAVRRAKPANLESVELFDVFRGKHVPEGSKSLAYSFTYRAADRTLKDEEVNAAHARVVEAFRAGLGASIRE